MDIAFVVAVALDGAIGRHNQLPWHLPADLKYFKQLTLGHHILMGRRTFESIGKPLPGRPNLVLSRQALQVPGISHFTDPQAAIAHAAAQGEDTLMVIGGGQLYETLWSQATLIYLTRVHTRVPDADTFFPALQPDEWIQLDQQSFPADDRNAFDYEFLQYRRR